MKKIFYTLCMGLLVLGSFNILVSQEPEECKDSFATEYGEGQEQIDCLAMMFDDVSPEKIDSDEHSSLLARRAIINFKINANAKNKNKFTTLMYVVTRNCYILTHFLTLQTDVDVKAQDSLGKTALAYAQENLKIINASKINKKLKQQMLASNAAIIKLLEQKTKEQNEIERETHKRVNEALLKKN